MVFPTLQFILFFAIVLALNAAVGGRGGLRKALLIAASYVFYAVWDWRFCFLMAGVSLVAWLGGLFVNHDRWGRVAKVASLVLLLGALAVFKYFGFFLLSLQQLLGDTALSRDLSWMRIVLPVGISFYTFQAISYVMDVSRRTIAARKNPADVALYISFFPQLVAGPIVRAADFLPQIDRPEKVDAAMRGAAVVLILSGLFKKMVVANYLSVLLVDPVFAFPDGQAALVTWAAVLGYGIQIYCDFSGYSDIAIGVALLLGYRFAVNFNQPYRAAGLADFWRRWHISLSSWIRDYLYIPLGGNRGGALRRTLVVLTTMTLSGLWHGAGWNFLLWGFLHGAALAIERGISGKLRPLSFLAIPVTLVIVFLLWIPFRAPTFGDTTAILSAMFRAEGMAPTALTLQAVVLLAIGLAMNWLPLRWRDGAERALIAAPAAFQALVLSVGVLLCFAVAQDGVAPFIYFQF
ncbi:MBOAT family O-acyltransferase [Pelagovum pacificum]|uniref:Probable alginate O-acetylase AlgI n=1 Tax=Pelagovum pacificum TaxID=2588711 RepID=A0A5C5GD31_9RHOB|nr:MBOAT family O-acyltransferase [Pelagovum pacificum]QQA44475.1 MBOAT family protein [Pelagovum pacificum]TNY32410.1 MBOAT family protein [Pelagovum pacificum]